MLKYDLTVALHVPPKIAIIEKPDGSGTRVTYDDPASVIAVPDVPGESVNPELIKAVGALSQKLEALVTIVTKVDD